MLNCQEVFKSADMDNKQWDAWMQDRMSSMYDGLHNYYDEEPLQCPNCSSSHHSRVLNDNQHVYECSECAQQFYSINGEVRLL